jgi:hypothetical protein
MDWHWHSRCGFVPCETYKRFDLVGVLMKEKRRIVIATRVMVDVIVHVVADVEHHTRLLSSTIRISNYEKQWLTREEMYCRQRALTDS